MIAAADADRLWAASLVCASATAAAVNAAQLGKPTYVITGCVPDAQAPTGEDDRLTASLIERVRLGDPPEAELTAEELRSTFEARRTLDLGAEHAHPLDVDFAARVDHFDFAMEAIRDERGIRLEPRVVSSMGGASIGNPDPATVA